jgi:hypothetical protein
MMLIQVCRAEKMQRDAMQCNAGRKERKQNNFVRINAFFLVACYSTLGCVDEALCSVTLGYPLPWNSPDLLNGQHA